MKEITRIFTVEITGIKKLESESELATKEEAAMILTEDIKKGFVVDDVKVLKVQDFIRDLDEDKK